MEEIKPKEDWIVAVLNKKHLNTSWGFIFDTAIQMHVEAFMQAIKQTNYYLCVVEDIPQGVFTHVKVIPIYTEGKLVDCKFLI